MTHHVASIKPICTYNQQGQLISEVFKDANGNVTHKDTFTYDSLGRKSEEKRYHADGKLFETDKFDYGSSPGNNPVEKRYNASGKLFGDVLFDSSGHKTAADFYNASGSLTEMDSFNTAGQKIEADHYINDGHTLNGKDIFTYDNSGHKIGEKRYDSKNKLLEEDTFYTNGKLKNSNNLQNNDLRTFNEDGDLTTEKNKDGDTDYQKEFNTLDKNHDGKISYDELRDAGFNLTDAEFKKAGLSDDMDYHDFVSPQMDGDKNPDNNWLSLCFDDSGRLDKDEFTHELKKHDPNIAADLLLPRGGN